MKGILADVNTQGPVEDLIREMQGAKWVEFWTYLGLALFHFEDVGLRQDVLLDIDRLRGTGRLYLP